MADEIAPDMHIDHVIFSPDGTVRIAYTEARHVSERGAVLAEVVLERNFQTDVDEELGEIARLATEVVDRFLLAARNPPDRIVRR